VLTHLSTLALIGMFAAMSIHATGAFADFAAGASRRLRRTLVLVLALVCFGIKAGTVPYFWLPGARSASTSLLCPESCGGDLRLLRVIGLLGPAPLWFRMGTLGWDWRQASRGAGPWPSVTSSACSHTAWRISASSFSGWGRACWGARATHGGCWDSLERCCHDEPRCSEPPVHQGGPWCERRERG
jgi:hypothetical protein